MDGRGSISVKVQQKAVVQSTIMEALASAVLEWFLIFLLFIEASFSYLVTKFARYCELEIPCLFCSRLDHVLGKEKAGFYRDLICNKHKLKISSLVLCNLHDNLVDVHGICENCLFSFATVNKSNAETYRLLVGKLGDEPHTGLDRDPLLADHSLCVGRKCSCCNEQWISRGHTHMLFQTKSIGHEAADLNAHLLATKVHDKDESEEIRDVLSQKIRAYHTGKKSMDPLSHVEYEKVKMTSDSESDTPISDDEFATNLFCVTEGRKQDLVADFRDKDLPVDDLASDKLIDPAAAPEPSIRDSEVQVETSDLHCTASAAPVGHGLEELNWQHVEHKTDVSAPSKLISFSDMIPSTDVVQSSAGETTENSDVVGVAESEKAVKNSGEMDELASNSTSSNEKQSDPKSGTSDTNSQMPNSLELGDAYKLAIGSRGRQLSGKLLEQMSFKDSARKSEDLKILLAQLSAARGIEVPLYDISPRVSGNSDEFRTSDTSTIGMQILQKRISLERNESGISLDGSIVSEIEGESAVDRLKRQVEHDRKLMIALYKELEEERNASAVAANQAMAMITRLQEDKAAFNMEALQCVRMMEEQADFDGGALQKANDLLAEKAKEIQDLEAELEAYKKRLGDLPPIENMVESNCVLSGETRPKQTDTSSSQIKVSICNSDSNIPEPCNETDETVQFTGDEGRNTKSSLLEFEDETLFILQSLRKLEKQLELFSCNEVSLDVANGNNFSVEEKVEQHDCNDTYLKNGQTEVDRSVELAGLHDRNPSVRDISTSQYEDSHSQQLHKGSGELQQGKQICRRAELDALRNEFLVLSGRLEALEAEHSFLENSMDSLRKGDKGIKFIQEIACQVRELHSMGIKRRN